jgi:cell division transport system permease protein
VFFQNGTEESDINTVQQQIENTRLIEEIKYVSQEEALEIYRSDFEDDPSLVDSITADALPPSLDIRVSQIQDMEEVLNKIEDIQQNNENIEDVMFFQDVIDTLEDMSNIINYGGLAVVAILSLISIALILITISFNINAHQQEIETMKLIGSEPQYIRVPYLLEGAFYGFVGSIIATLIMFIVWYGMVAILKDSDVYYFLSQTFSEIGTPYLKELNLGFIIKVFLAEITAGTLIGFASSSLAIWRHLK